MDDNEIMANDPSLTLTHAQRCILAEQCLPRAEYRASLERLHAEMLAEIERLRVHAVVLAETARAVERERCAMLCESIGRIGPEAAYTAGKCAVELRGLNAEFSGSPSASPLE